MSYWKRWRAELRSWVTESCGASDLISSGQNGFVIPSADLAALSAQIEWAFRHRDELAEMRLLPETRQNGIRGADFMLR
jgi:hypothetical protein